MEIEGTWEGYYQYGAGYVLPYFGQKIKIEVTITGTLDEFTGIVVEEKSELAIPYNARIKGYCKDNFISFTNTYPVYPLIAKDGEAGLIFEEGELESIYDGYIDSKFNAMYGTWAIVELYKDEYGVEQESVSDGLWFLSPKK